MQLAWILYVSLVFPDLKFSVYSDLHLKLIAKYYLGHLEKVYVLC